MYCFATNFYAIVFPNKMNIKLIGIVNPAIAIGILMSNSAYYDAINKLNAYPKLKIHGNNAVIST